MTSATNTAAEAGAVEGSLATLFVPDVRQWRATTECRIAQDPYSWLQAVHWVAGAGVYVPRRTHGPRSFGATTVRIAELLAELTPCRPGVRYLMRRTGLSERAVEYHLGMLREAGLLVYAVRGTRVRGQGRQASEFLRTVPPEFDAALGIRTVGAGPERRPVGIEEAGRGLIGKLAKKAARKTGRKTRSRTTAKAPRGTCPQTSPEPGSATTRCTPMQGGCSGSVPDATTWVPSEAKLARGKTTSTPPEKAQKQRRTLNRVGRRYQLARELTQQVPWLGRADIPRVAWVARHVADAGWTAGEVIAWLDLQVAPDLRYSPVGLLASRLQAAPGTWARPEARARAVEAMRDSRRAERERHEELDMLWQPPTSQATARAFQEAVRGLDSAGIGHDEGEVLTMGSTIDIAPEELQQLRAAGWQEYQAGRTALVVDAVESLGRAEADALYGVDLVTRVLLLAGRSSSMKLGVRR